MKDVTLPPQITVVALSETSDLVTNMAASLDPRVRLLRPSEVEDPSSITCALAWCPADDAFDRYPNMKMVSSIAAGVDSIIACPSLRDDITLTRIRDEDQARMMASFAAWHVIHHHRRMGTYIENQATQLWDRSYRPDMASDITVGILGFGLMGRHTARVLAVMGYTVIGASRSGGAPEQGVEILSGDNAIAQTAARSDILINLLPLTEQTRDILNAKLFSLMPKGATLVQLGRGEHLVEEDLLAALNTGHLSAASLDVFRQEPLRADSPFWSDPKVLVTPHKASDTTHREVFRQLVENYVAITEGRTPSGTVDRTAGY